MTCWKVGRFSAFKQDSHIPHRSPPTFQAQSINSLHKKVQVLFYSSARTRLILRELVQGKILNYVNNPEESRKKLQFMCLGVYKSNARTCQSVELCLLELLLTLKIHRKPRAGFYWLPLVSLYPPLVLCLRHPFKTARRSPSGGYRVQ